MTLFFCRVFRPLHVLMAGQHAPIRQVLRHLLAATVGLACVVPAGAAPIGAPMASAPELTAPALAPNSAPAPAEADAGDTLTTASPTLERIRQRGRIELGYRQSAVPFSFADKHEQPQGLAWAMCQKIVPAIQRELGLPHLARVPVRVIEQMRAPLVKGDAIDIDCAPSTVTPERAEQVAFSLPYYAAHVRLMVRRGSGIGSIDAMRGLRLVVVQGTTAERLVRARQADVGFQLLMARDYDEAFHLLREQRGQALALDDVLLQGLRTTTKTPDAFRVVGPPLADTPEYYALVLRKDDPAFKAVVDAALVELFRNGEMARLQGRWFQNPTPPYGVNLHMLPSPEVQALWEAGGQASPQASRRESHQEAHQESRQE